MTKIMGFRRLLFSVLCILLGTTVWADKYYMPRSYRGKDNPRMTLDVLANTGVKFMIYNTAINGSEDCTGFLHNNGVRVQYEKSKERDMFVYNETSVYTMEGFDTNNDGTFDYYAIKSVNTGTYVDVTGSTAHVNPADAKLYIYSWDTAAANAAARSGVNMENWKYNVVANGQITNQGHGSTVFVVTNEGKNNYWNGTVSEFAVSDNGHPYAFHLVDEVTSGDYLEDLHIYSRCDIYSAQVIYGYVQAADVITANPAAENMGYMIDGDGISSVTTGEGDGNHHFQFNLGKSTKEIYIYMQRNADATCIPTSVKIYGSTDGTTFTDTGVTLETGLAANFSYTSGKIDLSSQYSHIRIVNATAGAQMSLSEISILPANKKTEDALAYINEVTTKDCIVYHKGTAKEYTEHMEKHNTEFPDARLLSGVPLPGNKYRIYADAYNGSGYKNLELYVDGDELKLAEEDAYSKLSDKEHEEQKKFEWYCAKTTRGYLMFKNVATGKYLACGTISETPYMWTTNTNLTQRYGVPLKNQAEQFLAVFNDGSHWQGDIKTVQNQRVIPAIIDANNTPDDNTDDITIEQGLCTDFVFIPVEVDGTVEKKITFVANDIVQRNVEFLYDTNKDGLPEDIILPLSRMFLAGEVLPEFRLRCPDYHAYDHCTVNGEKKDGVVSEVNGVYKFNYENINDGDVLEIKLKYVNPFSYYNKSTGKGLYFIKNKRRQNVPQQASSARVGIDIDDDRVSTVSGNSYYAKYDTESTNLSLVDAAENDLTGFDASMLFYFEDTDVKDDMYLDAKIRSVVTTSKLAAANSWTGNGKTYYIQPHKTSSYSGYAIGCTPLGISNNPQDFLNSNHTDGDIVIDGHADDNGAVWEFVEVEDGTARELLGNYIASVAATMQSTLAGVKATVTDAALLDKIKRYESYITKLSNINDGTAIATLVTDAQKLSSLYRELEYALQPMPQVSTSENPVWYYIRNVKSGEYAKYDGDYMIPLVGGELGLQHMFYFTGTSNVDKIPNSIDDKHLSIDDYLKVNIHGFGSAGKTIIGEVDEIYSNTDGWLGTGTPETLVNNLDLGSSSWTLTAEYELDGTSYNAYGTALLASGSKPLEDSYTNAFQIYLKDDRSIVAKVNNADDRYRFWHTQDAFSRIKVVITYSGKMLTLDVYNSENTCETINITGVILNFSELSVALPKTGAKITSLVIDKADAMTWGESGDALWHILPSSNTNHKGLAIVMESAHDSNLGWTSADGLVQVGDGGDDNSSWEIVKIEEFSGLMKDIADELKSAVYDKELVELCRTIREATICTSEDFNNLYKRIREYQDNNRLSAFTDMKRPAPGKFYTIRHISEAMPNDFRVDELNSVKVDGNVNDGAALNSRGVWFFEGTDANGFYNLDSNLKLKSLHTHSYLAGNSFELSEANASALTIEPVEASIVRLKIGDKYLRTGSNGNISVSDAAVENPNYVATTFERVENEAAASSLIVKSYNNRIVSTDFSATVGGNAIENYKTGGKITDAILCPDVNATATNPEFVFTVAFSGLPAGAKFNKIGLDIHALNSSGNYQVNNDNVPRQWNVSATVNSEAFGTLNDIDIAKGVGSNGNVHKVWEITSATPVVVDGNGNLTVEISVTEGASNNGCFFGFSSIVLTNTDTDAVYDTWYIEEVEADRIKYDVAMSAKFSSVMLGYNAIVPAGVEVYNAEGIRDGYVSLVEVAREGGVIPANTPVILYRTDNNTSKTFTYTTDDAKNIPDETVLGGSLYQKYVKCEENMDYYKLMIKDGEAKMYWMYKEFDAAGNKVGENNGGHIKCSANKIYMALSSQQQAASYGMRFVTPGATDIDEVKSEDGMVKTIYDLQGRKLSEIKEPGFYIVNGKKTFIK